MSREVLQCHNVSRHFKLGPQTVEVLSHIDFSVEPGELVSIVGSSGSGKTTLLNLLAGLDTPSEGDVYMAGQALSKLGDRERARLRNQYMGFVFQFHHLLPEFSALENIVMPMVIGGHYRSDSHQKAHDLLERVGMKDRALHRPAELSGGERQRVAIARALINEPKVVLMDEPTGNLDDSTSEQVHDLIMELNRDSNASFVVVTHNQEWAQQMPRQLRLKKGRISTIQSASDQDPKA
ncbi:lipoprotein-releasing ABC transporter ATP-binding protein LolD [Saccharospirillum salsuginis]|uniref:Lipoprotein-releasing system ATP-binding protein LolD n=1 Tax=Saccharospirillum salsuginis TaxID=418750 RepID=A0A918N9T7_9GAMM|nr:lipoprotein-releasing ABC transporter ATP-binding protein LolD [Saccharospirillum salsuginis]GGX51738.1 lipoprotein-releasing system ATP-binding protein LolD [Saccharospirillum salsuginis]